MTWISYSRNLEDVMIRRLFRDMKKGTYIDVGASNPQHDSNTCALYEQGWSGLIIDPLFSIDNRFIAEYERVRPRDIVYPVGCSDVEDQLDFWIADGYRQMSTASKTVLRYWKEKGAHISTPNARIPVTPLSTIWNQQNLNEVHLLCIDTEGMEREVLRGLDIRNHRPWLIVAEYHMPGSHEVNPDYEYWSQRLVTNRYSQVWRDGANAFFLAAEHLDLRRHFDLPPNVFDDYKLFEVVRLERQVKELETSSWHTKRSRDG